LQWRLQCGLAWSFVAADEETTMTSVACLVVNYFSAPSVGELLDSFSRVELPERLQVVVVDNSCDDDEWQRLQAVTAFRAFPVETVRSDSNLGYAGGNNLAFGTAETSDPDVVFVINPDVTFKLGSLRATGDEVNERIDCVSGAHTMHGKTLMSGLGRMNALTGAASEIPENMLDRSIIGPWVHPMGHFLGLRADTWRSLGGLSDSYFLFCEELDLTLRLKDSGGQIDVLHSIVIEHEKGLTSGGVDDTRAKSTVAFRHATRSRVVLYRSHAKLKKYLLPMIAARLVWSLGLLVRSGPSAALAVLRGLRDGLTWKRDSR
jgi:N-acetylglucosaminyl-diphospho-decaprenol L-rhamnosyltransferase